MTPQAWYLAYGSNLNADLLARYLPGAHVAARPQRVLTLDRSLYFAGHSRRWRGGVAFLSVDPGPGVFARAYAVRVAELSAILDGENGCPVPPVTPEVLRAIEVNGVLALDVALSADGSRGKYNALARFPDIDGLPAVAVTTTHELPRRDPDPAYLAAIRAGQMP